MLLNDEIQDNLKNKMCNLHIRYAYKILGGKPKDKTAWQTKM